MRLFLLEKSLLRSRSEWPVRPAAGDVVVRFYRSQDPLGAAAAEMAAEGITVVEGDHLLDPERERDIDAAVQHFLETWHIEDGRPMGSVDGLQLSHLAQAELVRACQPGFLIRFGEICRELLRRYGEADMVVTDVEDGDTPVGRLAEVALPKRALLHQLAGARNIRWFLAAASAPHYYVTDYAEKKLVTIAKRWLGGLRLGFLRRRLALAWGKGRGKPRLYVHINHDIGRIAQKIGGAGDVDIYCDQSGLGRAKPLRYDHFLPLLPLRWIRACSELAAVARRARSHPALVVQSFDYSPYVLTSLGHYVGGSLLGAAMQAYQALRMVAALKPRLVVINGESTPNVRALIGSSDRFGYALLYIGHGWRHIPWGYGGGMNYGNVTIAVPGARNRGFYAARLPEALKPPMVDVPLPMVAEFAASRGARTEAPVKRILIIAYGPAFSDTITRISGIDDYMHAILAASRAFAAKGYAVTIRSKRRPFNQEYFRYWVDAFGLTGKVAVDPSGTLLDAVRNTDVMITGSSTCYYQALAMGRPTVFFEPGFDPRHYTGVVSRTDIAVPIARDADQIVALTEDALAGRGSAAGFPALFCDELAADYVGTSPQTAIDQLTALVRERLRVAEGAAP